MKKIKFFTVLILQVYVFQSITPASVPSLAFPGIENSKDEIVIIVESEPYDEVFEIDADGNVLIDSPELNIGDEDSEIDDAIRREIKENVEIIERNEALYNKLRRDKTIEEHVIEEIINRAGEIAETNAQIEEEKEILKNIEVIEREEAEKIKEELERGENIEELIAEGIINGARVLVEKDTEVNEVEEEIKRNIEVLEQAEALEMQELEKERVIKESILQGIVQAGQKLEIPIQITFTENNEDISPSGMPIVEDIENENDKRGLNDKDAEENISEKSLDKENSNVDESKINNDFEKENKNTEDPIVVMVSREDLIENTKPMDSTEEQVMDLKENDGIIENNENSNFSFIESLKTISKRNVPEVISVSITLPKSKTCAPKTVTPVKQYNFSSYTPTPKMYNSYTSYSRAPYTPAPEPCRNFPPYHPFSRPFYYSPPSMPEPTPHYSSHYSEYPVTQESYTTVKEPTTYTQTSTDCNCESPLIITIDQSKQASECLHDISKRGSDWGNHYNNYNNYRELLEIHDTYDYYTPATHSYSRPYYYYKRNSDDKEKHCNHLESSQPKPCTANVCYSHPKPSMSDSGYAPKMNLHSMPSRPFSKRSATCGCSKCGKTSDPSCSPEIIEKPTFVVEEMTETVEKPKYKVTEKEETVTKPDFVVKEVTEVVSKPSFVVNEKEEKVVKPKYEVEEAKETVKKPAFKVEEKPEVIVKPEFVIEEVPETIEKPEFTVEETVETVVKPKFKVETKKETVEKPNYVIKEHVVPVQKPEFVVTEKTEKIEKPDYKVEENVEVVKKPKYNIEAEIVPIPKPSFIIEETPIVVERPEFIIKEEILPVEKPEYFIKETEEIVEKPEYYVSEIVETVHKPKFEVDEQKQTVQKPSYKIEEEEQKVKKPQFVVKEQEEYVIKPEFIVEETTIPVIKPEYFIQEVVEKVEKPSYLVKTTPHYVNKPDYVVHEVVEKVTKPSYSVVEKTETVKKPKYVVEEEVETVVKPCFNVITCSGPPRRVSPKIVKGSSSRRWSTSSQRRPKYSTSHRHGYSNYYA